MYGYIYKFTLVPTSKIYVGKHKYQYEKLDEDYWGSGHKWKRTISNFSHNDIKREIIEFCNTKEELFEREKYWIKELNSRDPDIGYNVSTGGEDGFVGAGKDNPFYGKQHSDETKEILSLKAKERNKEDPGWAYRNIKRWRIEHPDEFSKAQSKASKHQLGTHQTKERRENIGKALTKYYDFHERKSVSENTRKNLSDSLMGHELDQDTRDKISKANSNKINITNGKTNLHVTKEEADLIFKLGLCYTYGNTKGLKCKNNIGYTRIISFIKDKEVYHWVHNSELDIWYSNRWYTSVREAKRGKKFIC